MNTPATQIDTDRHLARQLADAVVSQLTVMLLLGLTQTRAVLVLRTSDEHAHITPLN